MSQKRCRCGSDIGRNWLRGLDLNQRSRLRGIMSPSVTSQSFDKIRHLLFVALVTAQVFEHSRGPSLRFAISTSKALSRFPASPSGFAAIVLINSSTDVIGQTNIEFSFAVLDH